MEVLGGGLLTVVLCALGLLALGGLVGAAIFLLKLGVISSYWLKGHQAPEETGDDHQLDQSHSI